MGNDVRCTADAGGGIVTMLGDLIASTCNPKATCSRNIKRVLAVATRTYHVNITVGIKDSRNARFQNTIAETQQFVNGYATHLQGRQQGRNLFVGVFTLSDTNQNILHFFTRQLLVVQHPVQDVFHCLCHII